MLDPRAEINLVNLLEGLFTLPNIQSLSLISDLMLSLLGDHPIPSVTLPYSLNLFLSCVVLVAP